ncbi:rhodanese-related sulfurtransferase [Wigglesworthia glossinidia endosymbiont of Glossina morsitans morsitans (Yale colony)]|uniref:tRNA uridine(34) hydroxylase n=1 Tax=Wigglesworthia glossinidia endosymbiont of Glossina morsitans morsitans (Yale colony) TaxID=1142511 RepID=H6Q5M5_WIGGL|nr:rhodanese-related sulfurtransferase [Wigglesworthia glossinidia]AFA40929.1 rhodanese-related sulfurtransferase [Wigglesworthia glossinidia endosymbiont of Glossina morsitans morsitans (Yale colony)]
MKNINIKSSLTFKEKKTISFYRYFHIQNPKKLQLILLNKLKELKILGRIYIAQEGINAQIYIYKKYIYILKNFLYELNPIFKNVKFNFSTDDHSISFYKLQVKVRPHIVNDGIKNFKFNVEKLGKCISVKQFNTMSNSKNCLIVDVRNNYEYEIGHFENSIHVPAQTFRNQLTNMTRALKNYQHKKIVLYCTGGIRCEKASAWLIQNNFEHVFFLKGGIINYINYMRKKKYAVKFLGKMFVFDARLFENTNINIVSYCHQCKINQSYLHKNCARKKCNVLFLQCKICNEKFKEFCSSYCYNNEFF